MMQEAQRNAQQSLDRHLEGQGVQAQQWDPRRPSAGLDQMPRRIEYIR